MGKISCLNVYKHRVCGEPPANKHRRERARAEHTRAHTHTHTHTRTLTPANGPFSPPHFNPKPNPLSPGEEKQTPSPTTPFATKTLRLPPSLPPAATTHTRARCKISGSALCTTKGNSSWKGLGRGGWEGREKKKNPLFLGVSRGEGEMLHASPHSFPPFFFISSFLSLPFLPAGFVPSQGWQKTQGQFLLPTIPGSLGPSQNPPNFPPRFLFPLGRPDIPARFAHGAKEAALALSMQAAAPPRAGPAGGSACPKFALKPGGCRGSAPSLRPLRFSALLPATFRGAFFLFF